MAPSAAVHDSAIKHAILVLPLPSASHLAQPIHLSPPIASLSRLPNITRLLIIISSPLFRPHSAGGLHLIDNWTALQRLLGIVYVEASREAQVRGRVDMVVDVLLEAELGEEVWKRVEAEGEWDGVWCCDGASLNIPPSSPLSPFPRHTIPSPELSETPSSPDPPEPHSPRPSQHAITALGGTFDHLHAGHKILLSSAALLTSRKLIVGLTAASLLLNKSHAELVEPLEERGEKVERFVRLFRPGIDCEVVSISDVAGPTAWDEEIEALVVSRETVPGAEQIAKIREEKSLPPLTVYVIDVISSDDPNLSDEDADRLKKTKLSSTFIRAWIAKQKEGVS